MASESTRRLAQVAIAGALLGSATPASAQYINSSPGSANTVYAEPQGHFVVQGLTASRGDVTVVAGPLANTKFGTNEEAGFHAVHLPGVRVLGQQSESETFWFAQAGLAFGLANGLELAVFTPPWLLTPEAGHGDLPVALTLATTGSGVDIGLRNTVSIPTDIDAPWRWNPGLHMLGRMQRARFDLGAFFPVIFVDDETTLVALELPLRVSFDVAQGVGLGIETGVRKLDVSNGENDVFIPLGAHALYSVAIGEQRLDVGARFAWQSFVWANAPEDTSDRVLQGAYTFTFGVNSHFDLASLAE